MKKRIKKKKANYYRSRVKFYANENITVDLVDYLRNTAKFNIVSASEMGFLGRGDGFHFQLAKKLKRFLLTCDKDFLNHSKFPFNQCEGIIILDIPSKFPGVGWMVVWLKTYIINYKNDIHGTKIVLHERSLDSYYFDSSGKIVKDIFELPVR